MRFKKEDLRAMVLGDSGTLIAVEDKVVGHSRWSVQHDVIFGDQSTGKHYASGYSVGATESQDETPYEYAEDEIDCDEVEQQEVRVKKWIKKK